MQRKYDQQSILFDFLFLICYTYYVEIFISVSVQNYSKQFVQKVIKGSLITHGKSRGK